MTRSATAAALILAVTAGVAIIVLGTRFLPVPPAGDADRIEQTNPAYAIDSSIHVQGRRGGGRTPRRTWWRWARPRRDASSTPHRTSSAVRTRLTLPVLAVGGALWSDVSAAQTMRLAADDVTGVILDGCGHYPAEEQPASFTEILEDFLDRDPPAGVPHS